LPPFWADNNYQLQRHVVQKLCRQTTRIIEDIDLDSLDIGDIDRPTFSDAEGIDLLADAILVGGQNWIRQKFTTDLVSEPWLNGLLDLISLLRRHVFSLMSCMFEYSRFPIKFERGRLLSKSFTSSCRRLAVIFETVYNRTVADIFSNP
jgi:hypothetical protein